MSDDRTTAPSIVHERRTLLHGAAALAGLALAPATILPARAQRPLPKVPYVTTPQDIVERMLSMAKIASDDVVYDLGCGDGRIVISAARRYGARGVGIDLDPERIQEANANARSAGVQDRVRFRQADLFRTDFSPATVVMLYLLFEVNLQLMPQLWRQLRVGARVVSHDFHMGAQWPPEQIVRVRDKTLYAWTMTEELKREIGQVRAAQL
ncbi:class I SAM-dependent methyltransferase [Massilia sp. CFBP9012]|uniref:SAM-dependent methyltransferase n=1 Tax=Massilia sp. CFBP9012 TaxID=3096531 RepID=UPI002A6A6044|nr:class I SAM-dependent methyltransferase [Massilia sp. CFBP9012]MDY0975771.1 class I SAM-dependent methyltransferase [Massilia sp. CFBP9012]